MNEHPSDYREAMKGHPRSRSRHREGRFAWIGAAVAIVGLAAGCASAPRTPADPAVTAALARDGQRLFAAPSANLDDKARRAAAQEPSAAARDGAQQEDGR